MKLKTRDNIEVEVMQELEIEGRKYFLVNPGNNRFVNGVLTKYLVVPTAQFDKSAIIQNKAEVI